MSKPAPPAGRLRIAHVLLSRGFAGTERSTAESCNAQSADHDVLLIARRHQADRSGANLAAHLDPRVQVATVPARWFTGRWLRQLLQDWRPDVIHTHLRRATRLVARCHPDAATVATLHLRINGRQFLDMDALLCIAPWQLATIPESYRGIARVVRESLVPQPRIGAARRQELRTAMGAEENTFLIGGIGRLAHSKGWDILIEAFRRAALPGARLALVGDGRERARLEKLAAGLEVRFMGFQPDVKDYFQALDVFVCPSRSEPLGRVILESLDAGTPVIAAAADGPREILSEHPGVLVPVGDATALAQALIRQSTQPREHQPVVLADHHLDAVTAQTIRLYRDAMTLRRSRPAQAIRNVPAAPGT